MVYFGPCEIRWSNLGRTSMLAAWLSGPLKGTRLLVTLEHPGLKLGHKGTAVHQWFTKQRWLLFFSVFSVLQALGWLRVLFENMFAWIIKVALQVYCVVQTQVVLWHTRTQNTEIVINIQNCKNSTKVAHCKLSIVFECLLLIIYELLWTKNIDLR